MTYIIINPVIFCVFTDGYPMQDVIMKWKGKHEDEAVHGVRDMEIPQFTIVEYKTVSTVESLATGSTILYS